jgi:hypothetical protein
MKALECCSQEVWKECADCPLHKADCLKVNIEGLALDLLNSKNAEIEKLEELLDCSVSSERNVVDNIPYEKAEAIKEFAERLKEEIQRSVNQYWSAVGGGYYLAEDVIPDIDQIAKEMGVEL